MLTMEDAARVMVSRFGLAARCWGRGQKGDFFAVGVGGSGMAHVIMGRGNSWDEALAAATGSGLSPEHRERICAVTRIGEYCPSCDGFHESRMTTAPKGMRVQPHRPDCYL